LDKFGLSGVVVAFEDEELALARELCANRGMPREELIVALDRLDAALDRLVVLFLEYEGLRQLTECVHIVKAIVGPPASK